MPWLERTALRPLRPPRPPHTADLPHSPRAILKRQLARLAGTRLPAYFASELEFYLFDETYEQRRAKHWQNLETACYYIEDYHIFQTTKEEGVMRAISQGAAGVPASRSRTPRASGARARKRSTSAMPTR